MKLTSSEDPTSEQVGEVMTWAGAGSASIFAGRRAEILPRQTSFQLAV